MSAYSTSVNVFGVSSYPSSPQVTIPFEPKSIAIVNEDATADVFVSFDGVNDHGHLLTTGPSAGMRFELRVTKVWLRTGAAGTTPTDVRVMAES